MKGIWAIAGLVSAIILLAPKTVFADVPSAVCDRLIIQLQDAGFTFLEAVAIVSRIPGCG